ncbi:MAG: serine hydrolase domain-containing protein [Bacteroidota bacterium]
MLLAAILKLADEGKFQLSDQFSTFFPKVPADKAIITVAHLLTGQSGLPNFHHRADVDENFDLSWIDREEALRRLFEQPLLFEPGASRTHSHAAFVLLAAVVEKVTGQSYAAYLDTTFFTPLGMQHTGFYGDDSGIAASAMAVGYGSSRVGIKNTPHHWGSTSWLIMDSGGMVSTIDDLHTWIEATHAGSFFSEEAMAYYGKTLKGGGISDRGFLVLLYHDAGDTLIYMTNTHEEEGDRSMVLGDALMALVEDAQE